MRKMNTARKINTRIPEKCHFFILALTYSVISLKSSAIKGTAGKVSGRPIPIFLLKELGGEERMNMTALTLNLSHYVNGVAKRHGDIPKEMFPEYHIDSITNGVYWLSGHVFIFKNFMIAISQDGKMIPLVCVLP